MASDKDTPSSTCSVLDIVSHTVDTHLRLFRLLPWLLGATGLVIFYRHSRHHVRRFSQVTDIPPSCLTAHVPLHGVVVSLETQSVGVWHMPLWKRWIRIDHKPPPGAHRHDELLWLRFAGIEMTDLQKSSKWLHTHLTGRALTFVPIVVCDNELVSIIYTKKWLKRVCVNSELVVKGLARPDKLDELPSSKEVLDLVHRLLASDLRTKRRWWPW